MTPRPDIHYLEVLKLRQYISWVFWFFIAVVISGCGKSEKEEQIEIKMVEDFDRGFNLLRQGKHDEAARLIDSLKGVQGKKSDFFVVNFYHFRARWAWHSHLEPGIQTAYMDSMYRVDHLVDLDYSKAYAELLIDRGNLYLWHQRFDKAFESFYIARAIAQEHKDDFLFYNLHSILGNVMYQQKNYRAAARNYKRAYESILRTRIEEVPNKYKSSNGQADNVALSYMKLGLLDSADIYYHLALVSLDSFQRFTPGDATFLTHARGVVLSNQAKLEELRRNFNESIALYKTSIIYNLDSAKVLDYGLMTSAHLAELYLKLERIEDAGAVLRKIEPMVDSNEYRYVKEELHRVYWKYHLARADTVNAYQHYTAYKAFEEGARMSRRNFVDIDFEKELAKFEDTYNLRMLTKKSKVQQNVLLSIVVMMIAMVLISLAVRRNNRKLRALNSQVKKKNDQLSLSLTSLQQSQEENQKILRVVAHDLRTPIGGFGALTEMLLLKDYLEAEDRELIELIHTTSNETLGFVNGLLQIHQETEALETEPSDLQLIMEQSAMLQKHKAVDKEILLRLVKEHIVVPVNKEKMSRIMANIIGNAIKFSEKKSDIEIGLKREKNCAVFWVKDSGMGIPVRMRDKLFEIASGKQREGTDGEASHGLGMVITKQLVEAHKGQIWFDSEEGEGTTFYVSLPLNV